MSSSIKPVLGSQLEFGHPLATGLVGLWLMNEGSGGKVLDLSGNGNTGILNGTVTWQPGKFGPATKSTNTAGQFIQITGPVGSIPDSLSYTVIAWFNATDAVDNRGMLSWYDTVGGDRIIVYPNNSQAGAGGLRIFYDPPGDNVFNENGADLSGQWHQLAVVVRGANDLEFYRDAVLLGTSAAAIGGTFDVFEIHNYSEGGQPFNGLVDNVSLYNRALTVGEIALLYREPFIMFERDPIELWVGATSVGVPVGNAGMMTTNTGFWGPTF